jgi:hypothetical protein
MNKYHFVFAALFLTGCAGFERGCSAAIASDFGADWVIVQYGASGDPMNCWQLKDVSVANERQSDGVYWKDQDGHLVHISGWYNRVQVERGDFAGAAKAVGVDLSGCVGGKYSTTVAR